jgi:hypothetical protein
MTSLKVDFANVYEYRVLANSQLNNALTKEEFSALLSQLGKKREGNRVVADILSTLVLHASKETSEYRKELLEQCSEFLRCIDESVLIQDDYNTKPNFVRIAEFVLSSSIEEAEAVEILHQFLAHARLPGLLHRSSRGRFLKPFFEHFTIATFDAIYLPDDDGGFNSARQLAQGVDHDTGNEPTARVSVEKVLEWCANDHAKSLFAIQVCPVFVRCPDETGGQRLVLSTFAKQLFEHCPNRIAIFDAICKRLLPRSWSGSLAELIRQRLVLLEELEPNGDEDLRQYINEKKQQLVTHADEVEEQEEISDRELNERFE